MYSEVPLLEQHNDGSWGPSDWLIILRWAQETTFDWVFFVLASLLRVAVVTQQEATVSLNVEGAMLMPVFVSNGTYSMVKGLRLKDGKPSGDFPTATRRKGPDGDGTGRAC